MSARASFVIPCHNDASWVCQAIQSCLMQSVRDIEVIVVDDGSTDGSREAIEWQQKYDDRVKPVFLPENKGRSNARNEGNAATDSPVIMVLDADDIATKNRAKITLALFEEKNPDVVYGQFYTVDEFGTIDQKVKVSLFSPESARKSKVNGICHSTMAYRKGVSLNVPYNEEFGKLGLDDWKFQWDCHDKGYKFAVSNKPLCYYRLTPDGISRTRNPDEVSKLKEVYLAKV